MAVITSDAPVVLQTARRKPEGRAAVVDISSVASLDAVLRSLNMLRIGGHPVTAARMAAPVEVVNSLQALEDEHDAHLVASVGAAGEVRSRPAPHHITCTHRHV